MKCRMGLLAALLVVPVACQPQGTNLSGRVKMDGNPLAKVLVVVVGANNKLASGSSDESGAYSVSDPPVGPAKIQIIDPPGNTKNPRPGLSFSLPPGSGIDYVVKEGNQQFDIDWKPIVKGK